MELEQLCWQQATRKYNRRMEAWIEVQGEASETQNGEVALASSDTPAAACSQNLLMPMDDAAALADARRLAEEEEDFAAFGHEVQQVIRAQQHQIVQLERQAQQLANEAAAEQRYSHALIESTPSAKLTRLQQDHAKLSAAIELEGRRAVELRGRLETATTAKDKMRDTVSRLEQERRHQALGQTAPMAARTRRTLTKVDDAILSQQKLREEIDHLRKEKLLFLDKLRDMEVPFRSLRSAAAASATATSPNSLTICLTSDRTIPMSRMPPMSPLPPRPMPSHALWRLLLEWMSATRLSRAQLQFENQQAANTEFEHVIRARASRREQALLHARHMEDSAERVSRERSNKRLAMQSQLVAVEIQAKQVRVHPSPRVTIGTRPSPLLVIPSPHPPSAWQFAASLAGTIQAAGEGDERNERSDRQRRLTAQEPTRPCIVATRH